MPAWWRWPARRLDIAPLPRTLARGVRAGMMERVVAALKANWVSLRVIGTFLALIFAFFFLLTWDPIVRHFDIGAGIARLTAVMSYGLLKVLGAIVGFDMHRLGTVLGVGDFEVDVSPACSGAVPTSIYLSAVFAYPAARRAKLIGATLGVAVIHLTNLIRVCMLFLVGLYAHQMFHQTHVYVAQALVICVAVAMWLYWVTRFANAPAD